MALTIEQIQDNITNGGDIRQIINQLADYIQANPGGGGVESETSYESNAEAVAALGVGKLYKSTTVINGSPIILLTV